MADFDLPDLSSGYCFSTCLRYLHFVCDMKLNHISNEWLQILVRLRRANGIRDDDRE